MSLVHGVQPTVPISLVVPTRRPQLLCDHLIPSLRDASPRPSEVIVVDDAAVPPAAGYLARFPEVRLVTQPRQGGPARARNLGASIAREEIIMFLDDDVIVPADLFGRVLTHFEQPEIAAVTGLFSRECFHTNLCSRYKNDYMHYICRSAAPRTSTLLTAVCAVRREAFRKVGGFDENIRAATVEDVDLGRRLSSDAPAVLFDADLQVVHLKRYDPVSLLTSHFQRSRDMARYLLQKGPAGLWREIRGSQEQLSLPWQFGAGVVLTALALAALIGGWWMYPLSLRLAGIAMAATLAINLPFVRFVAAHHGVGVAVFSALALLAEFVISVAGALWAMTTLVARSKPARR